MMARRLRVNRIAKHPADVICEVLETVDGRCLAADGPVPPTLRVATDDELRQVYVAADQIRRERREVSDPSLARDDVRRVPCPSCGAPAGSPCVGKGERVRLANHLERVRLSTGARR